MRKLKKLRMGNLIMKIVNQSLAKERKSIYLVDVKRARFNTITQKQSLKKIPIGPKEKFKIFLKNQDSERVKSINGDGISRKELSINKIMVISIKNIFSESKRFRDHLLDLSRQKNQKIVQKKFEI